ILPGAEQWTLLSAKGHLTPSDLADVSRTATLGRRLWQMPVDGQVVPITLGYPAGRINSLTDLESLPVGVNGKLIPLKALAQLKRSPALPDFYRENQSDVVYVEGRVKKGDEGKIAGNAKIADTVVNDWKTKFGGKHTSIVTIEDASVE